jgi:hypothetical protein
MEAAMVNVMEEKDLHVAVYERVGFKFEALTKIVEELARGIRHSAELPLVERDKNDAVCVQPINDRV